MAAPVIGRRQRWAPGPTAQVDWTHPLAQGLARFWIFQGATSVDLVANDPMTYGRNNADTGRIATPFGLGFQAGADGGANSLKATKTLVVGSNSVSVFGDYCGFGSNPNLEALPSTTSGASIARNRDSGDGFVLAYHHSTTRFYFMVNGSGLLKGAAGTTVRTLGQWYTVGGTYKRETNSFSVFVDGRREGTDNYTVAGTFGGTFNNSPVFAGGADTYSASTTSSDKRRTFLAVWVGVAHDDGAMAQLHADPFCMLRF